MAGTPSDFYASDGWHRQCLATVVNAVNPFQVPPCLQKIGTQQRRRENFKAAFFAVVAIHVLVLFGVLIQGCKNQPRKVNARELPNIEQTEQQPAEPARAPVVEKRNETTPSPAPSAPPIVKTTAPTIVAPTPATKATAETFYVVKAGDTLLRIAKLHSTSVKAIKEANGLNSDRLAIGVKLKIPAAKT
jgi:LysM repeat protein